MRFLYLLPLPFFASVVYTAPIAEVGLEVANQTPNPAGIAHAHLEDRSFRDTCTSVQQWVYRNPSTALLVLNSFVTRTSQLVENFCDEEDSQKCRKVLRYFQLGWGYMMDITTAIQAVYVADGSNAYRGERRSLPIDGLNDFLVGRNYTFDSHELVANPLIGFKSNASAPALAAHYRVKGLKHSSSNATSDFDLHHFEDGTSHLHVPGIGSSSSSAQKRHDGWGVKIAFSHSSVNLDASHADVIGASTAMSRYWYRNAINGKGELFGTILKNEKEAFFYRTIVETDGFGEQYEDVNACGPLSGSVPTQGGPPSPF